MLFLESPSRAESYSTGIKSKTDINFAKSLWYFHPRYAYDYTFEWEKDSAIWYMNHTYYVYLEKNTKHWEGAMQLLQDIP